MADADSTRRNWKQRLTDPKVFWAIGAGAVVGAAIAGVWWRVWAVPDQAIVQKRYQATMDIARLYGLQLAYKSAHGSYANDVASLLSVAPDAAALKSSLAENVDMNTLTVVGDANRFKVELNVLDAERTPIKIKGPIVPKAPPAEPSAMPAPVPATNSGAPIGR